MIRTTNFIVIKEKDLKQNMPSHFTPKYGVFNPDTKRMNMRSWGELIEDESYKHGHGGSPQIDVDEVLCRIVGLRLDFLEGDYEAACEYGQGKEAPFGEVLSWQKAEELQIKYKINEQ